MDYVDGITIIDISGIILFSVRFDPYWNDSIVKSIVGKKLLDVFSNLNSSTSTLFKCIETGKPVEYSQTYYIKDYSQYRSIEGISYPIIINGNIVGALDVTKEKNKPTPPMLQSKAGQIAKSLSQVDFSNRARYNLEDIICSNVEMKSQIKYAEKIANSTSPVLISGETGTGKELFAHGIHNASNRHQKPFVVQNCSAIPENLLESILFGTCKGSFTGALDRKGLFEIADGGTIFLDEIHAMPLNLQPKLLRVIQDGCVRKIGCNTETRVDVRIIAAVNMDLDQVLSENIIRKDLFYRLSVLVINIPPLRERKDDIKMLTHYFIVKYDNALKKNIIEANSEVMQLFMTHSWPGNVRELENLIEAAANVVDEKRTYISLEDLPMMYRKKKVIFKQRPLKETIEEFEKSIIEDTLNFYDNNVSESAKALSMPRQTLQQKMKKYNFYRLP